MHGKRRCGQVVVRNMGLAQQEGSALFFCSLLRFGMLRTERNARAVDNAQLRAPLQRGTVKLSHVKHRAYQANNHV